jgi:hypothetical protein
VPFWSSAVLASAMLSPIWSCVLVDHSMASTRLVAPMSSRNSFVSTEIEAAVSFNSVFMRLPASELVAMYPTSSSALTVKGVSWIVSSSELLPFNVLVAAAPALLALVVEAPLVAGAAVWADICAAHKATRQDIRAMIFMGAGV